MSEITTGGAPENWDHKDSYRRKGKDFMVEVVRYSAWISGIASEGQHRWCVYAYIYPKHPHFAAFDSDSIYQDASSQLHFHGGCSYLERPMYGGKVTCVKVGADYHHLHDDHFTHYATPQEAWEVFEDANRLFEQLQARAEAAKEQA